MVVEFPAASHVTLMLEGVRELLARNHTVIFAACAFNAHLVREAAEQHPRRLSFVPLPPPELDLERFHRLYTAGDYTADVEVLFEKVLPSQHRRHFEPLKQLVAQHPGEASPPFFIVFILLFGCSYFSFGRRVLVLP